MVLLHGKRALLASGAVAVDGPALFLEGTILVLALTSVLLVAETRVTSIVANAAIVPGTRAPARSCGAATSRPRPTR